MEQEKFNQLSEKIKTSLDSIRPYLQADGGDISLVEITQDLTIKVKLLGACGCCPHSLQTLKLGVEQFLKKEIPEIKEVTAV
ncbi:MAG: NifU family protein [Bacteroidia bacterium]|nr:NifU family protein [Bacteroidia bacterium]